MKTFLMAAAVASAAVLAGGCAMTDDGGAMASADMAMPTDTRGYMMMAHSSDMFEVGSSQLALQMSQNASVRAFAQMMVADHDRMMNEMMPMAQSMGMEMASMQMMPKHMQMMDRLRGASAGEFDMMYKREQMVAHREARMLHAGFAARGDNSALKAMAARAVPVIEMHMKRAEALPGRM